jgi:predicted Co/Zn/Cd cation transporter (cation efflux family)
MVTEQRALQVTIVATVLLASTGIAFGLYAGSQSIVFDGLFNAIDSAMAGLSLLVSRLLLKQPGRRFQRGYWHIEPMVLALYGSVLVILCVYALINSIDGLMRGGQKLAFDEVIVYSLVTALGSGLMYGYLRRCNRRLRSELIQIDLHSWLMSTSISLALLLAFSTGYLLQGSQYEELTPYIDPLILALLTLGLIPAPCRTVWKAAKQILRITPTKLDSEIAGLMTGMSQRYGFESFSHCVSRIGRGLFVEIHILLPMSMNHWPVSDLDDVRAEIAAAIGSEGPNRWLAIGFTCDKRWL